MLDFKVIIAGGRDYDDFDRLVRKIDKILSNVVKKGMNIIVVSGCAKGADQLGEKYAELRGYYIEKHPADWDKYGKSAGYRRNAEMAKSVDENIDGGLVAFWDYKSRGTENMIDIAKRYGLSTRVIEY